MATTTGTTQQDSGIQPNPEVFDTEEIISLHRDTLERLAAVVQKVGKQTTAGAFALGKSFSEAKELLPKKAFSAWLKATCSYTVRSAWNYASVHEKLADLAPKLEAAAVGPTVLFEMAKAERELVIPLIEEIEAGKVLTVADVKARLRVEADAQEPGIPAEIPGLKGLDRLIQQRQQHDAKLLVRYLRELAEFLRPAVEKIHSGKRVTITSLKNEIELELRYASELLRALVQPMEVSKFDARREMDRLPIQNSPAWQRAISALKQAEYSSTWPDGRGFQSWLLDELHPAVEFILEGAPWADETIEEASTNTAPVALSTLALPLIGSTIPAQGAGGAHG